jgi:hypothetical protein
MTTQFYKAPHAVQAGGIIYAAGEPFVWESTKVKVGDKEVDTTPGESWEKVAPKDAAIMATAQEQIPDDADLEALPVTALKAVAYMRRVSGLADLSDAEALRTAIRASYAPNL